MIKNDLILRNPLRLLGYETDEVLPEGGFGAVLARAGVGKTALLVQLALNTLFRDENVLHISLNDPVNKVILWYQEVYHNLTSTYNASQAEQLWQSLLPHRFIMNFKAEGFSVPTLEERITDLISQKIFSPQMVIVDGLIFNDTINESLSLLKSLAKQHSMQIWFAIRIHRHEKPESGGMPIHLSKAANFFNIVLQLQPEDKEIHVKALKGEAEISEQPALVLDPSTMLIKNSALNMLDK